jgi:hypothetical protein
VVGRYEQSNGRSVEGAENFSWSGMSSAVRRLTQGALAPNPHVSVIKCASGQHEHFTCFPSTCLPAGAQIPTAAASRTSSSTITASSTAEGRILDSSIAMKDMT